MILLARDTGTLRIDAGAEALCVVHPSYRPPVTSPLCHTVPWAEFEADRKAALGSRSTLIVVGMNRIINPGNRTAPIFEFLHNQSKHLKKVSVDNSLFIGEPWRSWFHFGFVGAPYFEYTYSYLAESHWKAARDGIRPDPFCLPAILSQGLGVVRSREDTLFGPVKRRIVPLTDDIHDEYRTLKERCFAEEHTIGGILGRLSRFARTACPERRIPTATRLFDLSTKSDGLFDDRSVRWTVTDLAIDRFLTDRLEGLIALTNALARGFHDSRLSD